MLRYGVDYPIKPPTVKLITTGGMTVRFNPNLYSCGKVCLSILGTWQGIMPYARFKIECPHINGPHINGVSLLGPAWTPAQTLFTTLLSIQSLMSEKPYHNEPGYEENASKLAKMMQRVGTEDVSILVSDYNEVITYETIRVAVIQMLDENSIDARNMPQILKNIMIWFFKNNYNFYENLIKSKESLDGQPTRDPFRDHYRPKNFEYKKLLEKLLKLKERLNICDNQTPTQVQTQVPTIGPIDPLFEPYKEMITRILSKTEDTPKSREETKTENWDELIESMNEETNEELEEYVSDDEEMQEQTEQGEQGEQGEGQHIKYN